MTSPVTTTNIFTGKRHAFLAQGGSAPHQALLELATSPVQMAYGLFKMSPDYAGAAIRVKDALDAEADIGFDADGILDIAALSGDSPYKIVKWYDQSGNGRDATNATGAAEPTLNTAEVAARLDANFSQFWNLPDMSALTAGEAFVYRKLDNDPPTTGNGSLWAMGVSGSEGYVPYVTGNIYESFGSDTRKDAIVRSGGAATTMAAYHVYSAYSAASDWADYVNGIQIFQTDVNNAVFSSSPWLGKGSGGTSAMLGYMRAFVLFAAKVTDDERAVFSDMSKYVP